jgi:hypothetical protein
MKVGGPPAAFLEFLPAPAGAGFVSTDLWLHGFSDRSLVDCDPEWHPVRVDGHNGVGYLIGELVTLGRGLDQLKLVRTELVLPQ